jgi:hypothetical protein
MDALDHSLPAVENELGPRMFTKLLLGHGWERKDEDATVAGVRVLNSKRFYPYPWQESYTPDCVTPGTYAVHHWAHTWNPARKDRVSIVIPCYNQTEHLPEAIESCLAQTVQPEEIIVVDDGSTKGDVAAVVKAYPTVKLIRRENGGVAAARNTGIKTATGEWICALDSDDYLHPRFIERLIGRNDVVSPLLQAFGAGYSDTWGGSVKYPSVADFARENSAICGSLFRKVWWERVGGYDENMRHGYEDWDFWTRLAHAGARFTNMNEVLFHYRRYPESRADVPCSLEHARARHDEIMAYMHQKWTALGIPQVWQA